MYVPSPSEFAAYTSSACGALLVAGSLALLYKGVITLSQKSQKEAITLEFRKQLRVSSHYPALGLFILGWVFVLVPMTFYHNSSPEKISLVGNIKVVPSSDIEYVTLWVSGESWEVNPDSDGSLRKTIYPNLDYLEVEVASPGRPSFRKTFSVDHTGVIDMDDISLPNPSVVVEVE